MLFRSHSNAPQALSLHTRGNQEHAFYHSLPTRRAELKCQLKRLSGPHGTHVVWFRAWHPHRYDYGEADLRLLPGLELVAELEDGIVFKVIR